MINCPINYYTVLAVIILQKQAITQSLQCSIAYKGGFTNFLGREYLWVFVSGSPEI